MKIFKDNRGMILVFTMIMMSVLLSTAIGFSFFIIADINQAKAVDDAIVAYYAADAGMERALYSIVKQKTFESMEKLKKDPNLNSTGTGVTLSESGANWSLANSTDYEKVFFRQRLFNGQSVKFYVLNRGNKKEGERPKSLLINWEKGKVGDNPSAINLQISMTQLSPQSVIISTTTDSDRVLIYYTDTNEIELSDSSNNGRGSTCYNFKDALLPSLDLVNQQIFDYVVELKALGDSHFDYINKISATVYNDNCETYASDKEAYLQSFNPQGITNLTIKAEGTFGKSKQLIIAHLPPRNLVSSLLSFVLFSEQDLTKE